MNDTDFLLHCAPLILLALACPTGVSAEDPLQHSEEEPFRRTTNLQEVVRLAREHNPELQALDLYNEAALQRASRASSLPDSQLQVLHYIEPVETRTGPQRDVISLSQSFPWFGTLKGREQAAAAESDTLQEVSRARELEIMQQVSDTYIQYAYRYRALELTTENLELLEQMEPVTEERIGGGGDLKDLLQLKVEIGKLRDRRDILREQIQSVRVHLLGLVGLPQDPTLDAPDWSIPEPVTLDQSWLLSVLRERNPELLILEAQEETARARVNLARLDGYPDFSLGVSYIQVGEARNTLVPDSGKDPWGIRFSMSVPLFREKYRSRKAEALASARAVEQMSLNQRNKLGAELLQTVSSMEDAQRRLRLYDDALLPLANQVLEINRTGYVNSRVAFREVIESERTLMELQLEKCKAVMDVWKSRFAINRMTGLRVGEHMEGNQR